MQLPKAEPTPLENLGTVEPSSKPTACSACGGNFECGAALSGCWCTDQKLSDEQLADLSSKFNGCLCRKCLEEFASQA